MKRLLIALYLICVALFSVFFIPQSVETDDELIVGNIFKPIYWNPNQAMEEGEIQQPINDFEKYDWYEPRDTTNHYILNTNINYSRYFVCLFVITVAFAAIYVLIPKKEKERG